jgi:hypothetical protein
LRQCGSLNGLACLPFVQGGQCIELHFVIEVILKKSVQFFDNVLFFGALCYSVFWALLIFTLPINKYEWMLDSPEDFDLDKAKGYCALPLDPDPTSAIAAFLLGCPYLLFAIFYTFRKHKKTKLLWSIFIVLICAWVARFFIFAPHCP